MTVVVNLLSPVSFVRYFERETMTIREYLDKQERPYKRNVKAGLALFIISGIGMVVGVELAGKAADTLDWHFLLPLLFGIGYLASALVVGAATLILLIRIRCPKCNRRLRSRTKHWRYCPICGIDFDTESPGETENEPYR